MDFHRLPATQQRECDAAAGLFLATDQVSPEQAAIVRVLVVAAAVDRLAVHGQQDIALFDPGEFGRTALADGVDVEAALLVLQLKPLPERRILGAGNGDAEAWESRIFATGALLDEARHDVGGRDLTDLVLRIVAGQHTGKFPVQEDW